MKSFQEYLTEAEHKLRFQQPVYESSNDPVANDSASPIGGGTITPEYMKKLMTRPSHRKDKR